MSSSSQGPHVIHQVLVVGTRYGHVARCGCGWKAVHETEPAAHRSGSRHTWDAHGIGTPPSIDGEKDSAA